MFNMRNNFIFPNIHVLFSSLYKKNSPIASQNTEQYTLMRFMNNHTCEIIDFISGGDINKILYST